MAMLLKAGENARSNKEGHHALDDETSGKHAKVEEWRAEVRGRKSDGDVVESKRRANFRKIRTRVGESSDETKSRTDHDTKERDGFPRNAGVLVGVVLVVCLMMCTFTATVAYLAFRLGRKDRELRTVYAISGSPPAPQVTGAPVILQTNVDPNAAAP